jgi:hypothetical protein
MIRKAKTYRRGDVSNEGDEGQAENGPMQGLWKLAREQMLQGPSQSKEDDILSST